MHRFLGFQGALGPKIGENWGLLFTDEYIGLISKIFNPFMLSEISPLPARVLEGEGGTLWRGIDRRCELAVRSLISIVRPGRVIFCKRVDVAGERKWFTHPFHYETWSGWAPGEDA
jgi:hypothetical protein